MADYGIKAIDLGGKHSSAVFRDLVPGARVVKALNHQDVNVLAQTEVAGGTRVQFYSGDDAAAKAEVRKVLESAGYFAVDLSTLDVGGPLSQLPFGPLAKDKPKSMSAAQLLKRSLDTFLAKDMRGWADLCDENVVVEFPFSPDPASKKIVGRTAIYEYLRNYPKVIDVKSIPTLKIHMTDDPNVAVAEWSASGRVIGNGNPYEMSYATFVTFRNGLIVNYREYWNPQAFMAAMSGASF